jgi:hypothetical protein
MNASGEKEAVDDEIHGFSWCIVVQDDKYATVIQDILEDNIELSFDLVCAVDSQGRSVINLASPLNRNVLLRSKRLLGRYEVATLDFPHYKTATCLIHLAVDFDSNEHDRISCNKVALKFMANREQFCAEVFARSQGHFDSKFVINVLRAHDSSEDGVVLSELIRRGFGDFPYLIVMPQADRSLQEIIAQGVLTFPSIKNVVSAFTIKFPFHFSFL